MSKVASTTAKRSYTAQKKDIKELLGNPKITFVLGNYIKFIMFKVVLPLEKEHNALSLSRNSALLTSPLEI